jgi:hypothetical protein
MHTVDAAGLMGERGAMRPIAPLLAFAAFGALMLAAGTAAAGPLDRTKLAQAAAKPEPLVPAERHGARAQARPRPQLQARPRARIRVHPRYPYRHFNTIYPLPYPIEYPGPNAVRHCVNHYRLEMRPSGDVIVPHMRCWWAPG